jgi:hypothetical protein
VGEVIQLAPYRAHRAAPPIAPAAGAPVDLEPAERLALTQAALECASLGLVYGMSWLLERCPRPEGVAAVTAALAAVDARLEELQQTRRQAERILRLIESGDLVACLALRDQLWAEQASSAET